MFAQLCRQPSTWQFLLQRDFGINSNSNNAKNEYFKYLIDMAVDATLKYIDFIRTFLYKNSARLKSEDQIELLHSIDFYSQIALSGLGKDTKFIDPLIDNDLDALLAHIRIMNELSQKGDVGFNPGHLDYLNNK